jgi:hypothetical protein
MLRCYRRVRATAAVAARAPVAVAVRAERVAARSPAAQARAAARAAVQVAVAAWVARPLVGAEVAFVAWVPRVPHRAAGVARSRQPRLCR